MDTTVKDRFLMKFKKDNTAKTYSGNIDMFYKFILEKKSFANDKDLLKNIDYDDVEDYFYSLENCNYKKATINLKIEAIKQLFGYAVKKKIIPFNLTDTIEKYSDAEVKEDKTEKYIPTLQEVKRILEATYKSEADRRCEEFNNARDRFLASLLSVTGMRIEEALGIEMNDIEYVDNNCCMINILGSRVKNGVDKRVPVPSSVLKYFEEYKIQRMIKNERFNSNLLFFSKNGKKLFGNSSNSSWLKFCKRSNIEGHITNHCFRHFLSAYLQSKGYDVGMIYKIMGWVEDGIITVYSKKANDKSYDELKLKMCDVF